MRRLPITAPLFALLLVVGFALPVRGGVITGTLAGDSTLTTTGTPGVFVQNLSGSGEDTTFGSFLLESLSTIDFTSPPAILISSGSFAQTFAQGTLLGTSSGSGTASGQGTATFSIDVVFTGGTGLFAGATGEATITGTITSTSATTESMTGSYVGSISTVPEPSTLVISSLLLGTFGIARVRKRTRPETTAV